MTGYDVFDRAQNGLFALLLKPVLKLMLRIKVILDRLFAASCDEDDLSDARDNGLFDNVLNDRSVIDGNSSLGIALVAGSMRVPSPATGITAFLIGLFMMPSREMRRFLYCRNFRSQGFNFRLKLRVLTLLAR